jgi:predicted RNase H-like nuclease
MTLYGIDGCRGGWIVASWSGTPADTIRFEIVTDLGEVVSSLDPKHDRLIIDIPIGLADDGPRTCDRDARRLLGPGRASSVFPPPVRAALSATSYAEACGINEAHSGKRISRQSYAILPKIAAVNRLVTPMMQDFVREAHPEVTFMVLGGLERGLPTRKKRVEGRRQRLEILRAVLPTFDPDAVRAQLGRGRVAIDDVIDAAACLATADRVRNSDALVLPVDRVEVDGRGLRMEIVA